MRTRCELICMVEGGRMSPASFSGRTLKDRAGTALWFFQIPQFLKLGLVKKRRCQIRLRIKIDRNDPLAHLRKNPCQMVNKRSLANPAFDVEKSQYRSAHLPLISLPLL